MPIEILLLDDHAMMREGLAVLLATQADMRVVASFALAEDALAFALRSPPDVAVLDITLAGADGIEVAQRIHEACAETHILMLSMHASSDYVDRAFRVGASGYVPKESAGAELITAIRAVHAGQIYLSEKIPARTPTGSGRRPDHPLERISARERQVLKLVVEGHTSNEVAKALGLSPKSVDTYRSRVMTKLGIEDLPGLVKYAIRHGLTTL